MFGIAPRVDADEFDFLLVRAGVRRIHEWHSLMTAYALLGKKIDHGDLAGARLASPTVVLH